MMRLQNVANICKHFRVASLLNEQKGWKLEVGRPEEKPANAEEMHAFGVGITIFSDTKSKLEPVVCAQAQHQWRAWTSFFMQMQNSEIFAVAFEKKKKKMEHPPTFFHERACRLPSMSECANVHVWSRFWRPLSLLPPLLSLSLRHSHRCRSGLSVRGSGDQVVLLPPSPPVPQQLHQGHWHVGCWLHPGWDADWTDAIRRYQLHSDYLSFICRNLAAVCG